MTHVYTPVLVLKSTIGTVSSKISTNIDKISFEQRHQSNVNRKASDDNIRMYIYL